MSKMAALSAMAGKAGGAMGAARAGMGAAGGAVGARMGAASTALQTSKVGVAVSNTAAKEVGITINYGQIGIDLMFFGFLLPCHRRPRHRYVQQVSQNRRVSQPKRTSRTSCRTRSPWPSPVPCTLLLGSRLPVSKLSGIMVLLFGIMGVVGSSAALNWARTCEECEEVTIPKRLTVP